MSQEPLAPVCPLQASETNNPQLLTEAQLLSWTGYTRRADLERLFLKKGVRYFPGRGGQICTTLSAVNAALGVRTDQKKRKDLQFA